MHGERDRAGEAEAPWGLGDRACEGAAGGASPYKVSLQNVHDLSVAHIK